MKLLFAYSANFKKDTEGNYYTGGSITEEMWKRYTSVSEEFTVISRLDSYIYEANYAKKKFNVFDKSNKKFIPIPNLSSKLRNFFDIKKHRDFNKTIKNAVINNDIIIVRLPSFVGIKAIKYARKYKRPYLIELVGCPWDALWNHSWKGKIVAPFIFLLTKHTVLNASHVIYVTNEFLQRRYPTHGKSTNCSDVSLQKLDDKALENRLNKIKEKNKKDKIIIGTAAAVDVRYKGQQYVTRALGKLKKKGFSNYTYQLVGGGDQSFLKSIAKKYDVIDQVEFLGTMPHEEVFKWLDNIDIYIQPSLQEGLPRALIEAMSRGVPAIGSNAGGIPELLDKKYIVKDIDRNIDYICDILESLDINEMIMQAKRNYEKAKKYNKEILEKKREEFLKDFINNFYNTEEKSLN